MADRHARPPIALTMGEPGGVSQEITIKAWQYLHRKDNNSAAFFIIDDPDRYREIEIPTRIVSTPKEATEVFTTALPILPIGMAVNATPGIASSDTASAVIASIEQAVLLCLSGHASAVVTNPIQKKALADIGFSFPGHTEYLANLTAQASSSEPMATRTRGPVMMLAGPQLRTVPVTVHQSLVDAAQSLTREKIVHIAKVTSESLHYEFGIKTPRLAISGLNPHAGEQGMFGFEDRDIIKPSVQMLRDAGIDAIGPLPADTMFHEEARLSYDTAICMYHDQALIPVKTLDFHHTVNVTLGLPIIRTSPDHGCALDIAGQNSARADSLISAVKLAAEMAHRSSGDRHP